MKITIEIEVPKWAQWIVNDMDGLWVYKNEPYALKRGVGWRVKSGQSECLAENLQCELPFGKAIPINSVIKQAERGRDGEG